MKVTYYCYKVEQHVSYCLMYPYSGDVLEIKLCSM